jgi:hypothetical protein
MLLQSALRAASAAAAFVTARAHASFAVPQCAPKWDPPLRLDQYNVLLDSYESKEQAYQNLGVRLRIKGCKALVIRSDQNTSYLHCKHWESREHPCGWKAVLRKIVASGKWEAYGNGVDHNNSEHNRTGQRGIFGFLGFLSFFGLLVMD